MCGGGCGGWGGGGVGGRIIQMLYMYLMHCTCMCMCNARGEIFSRTIVECVGALSRVCWLIIAR